MKRKIIAYNLVLNKIPEGTTTEAAGEGAYMATRLRGYAL
jgi:hypothetical protein